MDLQTRKLKVIGYLIELQDEKVFSKIEMTISESQKQQEPKRNVKPFTPEQLINRAKRSNEDFLAGRIKSQEQLEIYK